VTKPGRKWPFMSMILSAYVMVTWLGNTIIGDDGFFVSLGVTSVAALWFVGSCWWIERRLKALDEWKAERELMWFLNREMEE